MTGLYRLRGETTDGVRTFPIAPDETTIGSSEESDVRLSIRGVSRHHARISSTPEGLVLEDLQSKNGVKVNNVRIQRTILRAGDQIQIGSILLELEEIDPEDGRLAIVTRSAAAAREPRDRGDRTTTGLTLDTGSDRTGLIHAFLEALGAAEGGDLDRGCGVLLRELHARGAFVAEWRGEKEPLLLASSGQLGSLAREVSPPQDGGHAVHFHSKDSDPRLTYAVLARDPRIGVGIWGEFQGRSRSELLMKTLVRIVARSRTASAAPSRARAEAPSLSFPGGYVIGTSSAMTTLYNQMKHLAASDLPVLVLGETGVGKESIAAILHISSPRRAGPLVAVNCAAIPGDLLEAEMFGIGKGVATGVSERKGKFQLAQGGTLFLDEVAEMAPALQAKLLRALQEREIQPVGGAPVAIDVRIVSATNSDLFSRVREGHFRRDVYYRLAGDTLHIPPLRERREDIPRLVADFLGRLCKSEGKTVLGVSARALELLSAFDWPGNVRELEHEIRRLFHACPDGQAIESGMLAPQVSAPPPFAPAVPAGDLDLEKNVSALELQIIQQALTRAGGNRSKAAKFLGISRNGLALKLKRHGLADREETPPETQ